MPARLTRLLLVVAVLLVACSAASPPDRDAPSARTDAIVVRVIDGDTLVVRLDGEGDGERRVRLLGVDTPEAARRGRRAEFFANEATAWVREAVEGRRVRLERDRKRPDTDDYGRLLRYVILEDGTSLNESLLRRGYAVVFDRDPFRDRDRYRALETGARKAGTGRWGQGGLAELGWYRESGLDAVRIYPGANRRWTLRYGRAVRTQVSPGEMYHELETLRGVLLSSGRGEVERKLVGEGWKLVPKGRLELPPPCED